MGDAKLEQIAAMRGRDAVSLVAITILVIIAGVFGAQWMAQSTSHRAALATMGDVRARADRDIAFHYASALGWQRAISCLDDRMTLIMQRVGTGDPLDASLLQRPSMEGSSMPIPSETQRQLLAEEFGEEAAQDYWAASQNVSGLSNAVTEIIHSWSGFALVDPINGRIDSLDRHQARLAASSVKAALHNLDFEAENVIRRAEALGLKPNSQGEFRQLRNCDDLWANGTTHPSPDTR